MATSRTGTAKWVRVRDEARKIAFDQGLARCPEPGCRVWLDWEYSRRPNSAEVDHIVPHSQGGTDTIENARVICRRCNQSLGGKQNRKPSPVQTVELDASPIW